MNVRKTIALICALSVLTSAGCSSGKTAADNSSAPETTAAETTVTETSPAETEASAYPR